MKYEILYEDIGKVSLRVSILSTPDFKSHIGKFQRQIEDSCDDLFENNFYVNRKCYS